MLELFSGLIQTRGSIFYIYILMSGSSSAPLARQNTILLCNNKKKVFSTLPFGSAAH